MKIIAYDHFRAGTTKEGVKPDLLKKEMMHVWRLQKAGVIREIYSQADAPGAVIVFECGTVDEAKNHTAAFPLSKANQKKSLLLLPSPTSPCNDRVLPPPGADFLPQRSPAEPCPYSAKRFSE